MNQLQFILPVLALGILASIHTACGSDGADIESFSIRTIPLAQSSRESLDDCEHTEEVCTASFPAQCYFVCRDGDEECACTESYPVVCSCGAGSISERDCPGTAVVSNGIDAPIEVCVDDHEQSTSGSTKDGYCSDCDQPGGLNGEAPQTDLDTSSQMDL